MKLRYIKEIDDMCKEVEKVQDGWDCKCNRTECYWNLWHPTLAKGRYNCEEAKTCVSESITEFKMTPNTPECKGYLNYKKFCGHEKF